jgi:excisionase family DNA binding protein
MAPTRRMLTVDEVARVCGISRATAYRHAHDGLMPSPVKIGRGTRWHEHEITQWLDSRERIYTDDDPASWKGSKRK